MRNELGSITPYGEDAHRVYVSAGYDKKTGKRIRPSKVVRGAKVDSKKELRSQLMRAGRLSPGKITLTEFMEDVWLPTKSSRRRRTIEDYSSKIRSCITPYIGHLDVKGVDAYVVERWMADLERAGKSPQTIKNARGVLRNAMRAAVRWHHIASDPTEGTETPKVTFRPRILTGAQMDELLTAFEGHAIEPIVVLCVATGMRRCEACALDWGDIDFVAGTVRITRGYHQRNKDVWFEKPKSETSRRLLGLPAWAIDRLKELRGVGPLVPDGGDRMAPNKVSLSYRTFIVGRKLPYVTIRELRNSHGTYLRTLGVAVSDIADQLGHADERVTKQHYIDRDSLPVSAASVVALETMRVRQNAPDSQAKHGQNPATLVDDSTETISAAR